ncbi:MAG TPA: HAMP domain-containing sensor histidine kinase [Actinomycetota bacterium]
MSLRTRLLITLLLLTGAGLAVADVATVGALRSFLLDRVDQQLVTARQPAAIALSTDAGGGPGGPPGGVFIPPGTYAEFRDAEGDVVNAITFSYQEAGVDPGLRIPEALPGSGADGTSAYFTCSSDAGGSYRGLATAVRGGGTLIVAIPLDDVRSTLQRLVIVMLVVGGVVLMAVAAFATWRVRAGLRPLEEMGETAGAIAAGDLTRRVEPTDERTEVGRLGLALNAMLTQIESAFEERRASEERLRRFVADASHELRTPLTSIRGYAELFRRGAADRPEDLAKAMDRIEAEAARMGILVEDLLLLARIDESRPLEREPLDLPALVGEAVDDARVIAPARTVTLEVGAHVSVIGDRVRLRQVVDNLLDNVRAHTPDGVRAIVGVDTDGSEAVLTVEDDGPGLDVEDPDKVFERFFRTDASRSRSSGGSGLGLSIVAAVVAAHGGRVEADRSPLGGARFRVFLPLAPDPAGIVATEPLPAPPGSAPA